MFNIFKKKPKGETATFRINGMHCSSCSLSIDGALEDTEGVIEAKTSYAKAETVVEYDPEKVTVPQLRKAIETTGYEVE